MNFTSRKLLAAALLAAIPMGSALACTTGNWTDAANGGGVLTGTPTADSPTNGVARYSGECAVSADAGDFVTNNAPDGEGVYRARFYVYTSGSGTVFRATADDNNAGAEVLRVDYSAGTFSFFQNGVAAGTVTGAGVVANKWYSVELLYQAGEAVDGFSATVAGNQTFTGSVPAGAAGAGTIGSHSLGNGGTGTVLGDAFESTRSADTPIGRLCRGDVNGVEPIAINVFDRTAVTNEILNGTLAAGQPDCTEDGAINVFDRTCVTTLVLLGGAPGTCPSS